MTATTFRATTTDGREVTRTSKTMFYTHVVLAKGSKSGPCTQASGQGVWGWSQTPGGAAAMAAKAAKVYGVMNVEVHECVADLPKLAKLAPVESFDLRSARRFDAVVDAANAAQAEHVCADAGTRMVKGLCQPCYKKALRAAKAAAK